MLYLLFFFVLRWLNITLNNLCRWNISPPFFSCWTLETWRTEQERFFLLYYHRIKVFFGFDETSFVMTIDKIGRQQETHGREETVLNMMMRRRHQSSLKFKEEILIIFCHLQTHHIKWKSTSLLFEILNTNKHINIHKNENEINRKWDFFIFILFFLCEGNFQVNFFSFFLRSVSDEFVVE